MCGQLACSVMVYVVCEQLSSMALDHDSQAKKFVEEAPQVLKKDVSKEEAEKLKAALEAVGGVVEIE